MADSKNIPLSTDHASNAINKDADDSNTLHNLSETLLHTILGSKSTTPNEKPPTKGPTTATPISIEHNNGTQNNANNNISGKDTLQNPSSTINSSSNYPPSSPQKGSLLSVKSAQSLEELLASPPPLNQDPSSPPRPLITIHSAQTLEEVYPDTTTTSSKKSNVLPNTAQTSKAAPVSVELTNTPSSSSTIPSPSSSSSITIATKNQPDTHLSHSTESDFSGMVTILMLACFIGYFAVWKVTPALHTPLMALTNAISGIIIVGAIIALGSTDANGFTLFISFIATMIAAINIFGGFVVTQRMLAMFRKKRG